MSAPTPVAAASAPASSSSSAAAVIPVWLDCDPGHDDALAMMLAGHSSRLRILGVSTVGGNQSLEKTTNNALNVLNVSGLAHLPLYAGRENPLMRRAVHCAEIHGKSGLEGPHFPPLGSLAVQPLRALDAMRAAIEKSAAAGEPVTLIATGPLTNIALLLLAAPELAAPRYLREIVLMGGAVGLGNTAPAAEFNIEVDPEAARIVFESGVSVTMVPLEVTHTALVTPEVLQRIRAIGASAGSAAAPSPFAAFVCDLLLYFRDSYSTVFGFPSPPLHDPCAVLYVLHPDLFTSAVMRVDIECESKLCAGRTVCDVYGRASGAVKNARVCLRMDVARFWDHMISALESANKHSCLNTDENRSRIAAATQAATQEAAASPEATLSTAPMIGALAAAVQNLPSECNPAAAAAPASSSSAPTSSLASADSFPAFPACDASALYPGLDYASLPPPLREMLPVQKCDVQRASALAALGYPAVAPLLPHMLMWTQDPNWPVARVLTPFLARIGSPVAAQIRTIWRESNDHDWILATLNHIVSASDDAQLREMMRADLEWLVRESPEAEIREGAAAVLRRMATVGATGVDPRVTIMPHDIQLARRIRGERS